VAYGNSFGEYYTRLEVRAIREDGSLDCDQKYYDTARDTGIFLSKVDRLILKNYSAEAHIGTIISNCRAFRLPNNPGDTLMFMMRIAIHEQIPVVTIAKLKLMFLQCRFP